MKIIDNFLPEEIFRPIQNFMMGDEFPWYYNSDIDNHGENSKNFQFTHAIVVPEYGQISNTINMIHPLISRMDVRHLLRVKANLNVISDGKSIGDYHSDVDVPTAMTAVYYINTNNGATEFETGKIVNSVENRIVLFDSFMKHRGISSTDTKTRVLININYIPA